MDTELSDETRNLMVKRYYELCDIRDEANARAAPLQAELDLLNAQVEDLRLKALDKKAEIEAERGGAQWLSLKSEIGRLANALRFIPPRPTS